MLAEVARALHDDVVQQLCGVALSLGAGDVGPEEAQECARELETALGRLRTIIEHCASDTEQPALEHSTPAVYRRFAHLPVRRAGRTPIPHHLRSRCASVLAELLRNCEKHAVPTEGV